MVEHGLQLSYFTEQLLQWYADNKRDLPWRKTKDPYKIWVSEVMLQQTKVDTVIPYYERFLSKFPTIDALAEAPEEEVLKCWEGLGYYSRARNLQAAVKEVKTKYDSRVPNNPEQIRSLKGVGPYTAGAILSIAYNLPEPAVDGNVLRVLSRYFLIEKDVAKQSTRVYIEKWVRQLIPEGEAGQFNQALMELGATVCTPKSPQCAICPVSKWCKAKIEGKEERLPIKTKAKPPRPELRLALLVEGKGNHQDCILLRQRPVNGLLAKMWELPHIEDKATAIKLFSSTERAVGWKTKATNLDALDLLAQHQILREKFLEDYSVRVSVDEWYTDLQHIFSHIHWYLRVFTGTCYDDDLPQGWSWIHKDELPRLTFPNVFNRLLKTRGWIK